MSNAFEPEGPSIGERARDDAPDGAGLSATSWTGAAGGGPADGEAPNLEAYVADRQNLHEHLAEQLALACPDPRHRIIGQSIIDAIDESGYLREDLGEIAARLEADRAEAERILATIQTFDPSGVGARDLAECLAIQLKERDRYRSGDAERSSPIFRSSRAAILRSSPSCAASTTKTSPTWRRSCAGWSPSPAARSAAPRFSRSSPTSLCAPPRTAPGMWSSTPTRCRAYWSITVMRRKSAPSPPAPRDKSFISSCLQNANWLTKSLEQRPAPF